MRLRSILWLFFLIHICFAQNERSIARDGNKNYAKGLFSDSEINYKKSLSKNKDFEEVQFNLADALFRQDRYDESINILNDLISDTKNTSLKSESYYNLGNNFLQKQELENAIDAYKNCLRLNPSDEEARYNLAKTISLMQQQEENEDEQEQNEDEQEQNEDEQEQNSGETSDQSKEQQQQNSGETSDQGDDKKDSSSSNDTEEGQENKAEERNERSNEDLSREDIERILNALEREEQRVQSEMQKNQQKGKQKLLEKDW